MTPGAGNSARTPYLEEVSEKSASGETARIYAEIRRLSGVPMAALIYRHLATHPGALESVWKIAGPLLQGGVLQERAWKIAREAGRVQAPVLPHDIAMLNDETMQRIVGVVDAYNRANPVNFLLVSVIRAASGVDGAASTSTPGVDWTPPPPIGQIPAIVPVEELPADVRVLVDAFAKRESEDGAVLVPTLYRHLAHWPIFLGYAHREVLPRLGAGSFQPSIEAFRSAIQRDAVVLVRENAIQADPLLHSTALQAVWTRFTGLIPELVVVGQFLHGALARRGD